MKNRPYIIAFAIATLLALAVWLFLPKKYSATTKLSDEYKEVDLAIGMNSMMAKLSGKMGAANTGVNDMGVYAQMLQTDDFAKAIARKRVAGKAVSYAKYLGEEDTVGAVKRNIEYNFSSRHQTLTIQFTDKDPVVASQMLDSVTCELQRRITTHRRQKAAAALDNAKKELDKAARDYAAASEKYARFIDANTDASEQSAIVEGEALSKEADLAAEHYKKVSEQYVRQLSLQKRAYVSFAVIIANTVPQKASNDHFWGYWLSFMFWALIFTKLWLLYDERRRQPQPIEMGDLFSPWSITLVVWGAILFFLSVSGDMLDPLSDKFKIDISLWVPILCVTSFITFNLMPAERSHRSNVIKVNITFFNVLYVIAMIITPLYIYQIYKLVSMFDTQDLMMNVRELAINGDGYGFLNYTFVVNEVLLLIALWRYPKVPMWQLLTIIAACLLYAVGNMEKITFFLVFTASVFVLYERRKISVRSILICGGVLILLFYVFNLGRSGEDSNYSKNESLFDFLSMYVLSAPVAFGRLHQTISDQFGSDTLWGIYLYFEKYFNGHVTTHQALQEFVQVPMYTNVYTVMRPYYTDFGHIGVACFAFLYGVLLGATYRLMKNRHAFGTCMYTYFAYVMALQFYDEFLTSGLPLIMQMTLLLWFITQDKIHFSLKGRPKSIK